MELELRHLRTLCAIADAGSVGRAAAVMGYSQPAMSTQPRRIERLFGEPLFLRGTSGVEPTAYGVEVVAQARDVLPRAEAIGRRGSAASGGTGRTLRALDAFFAGSHALDVDDNNGPAFVSAVAADPSVIDTLNSFALNHIDLLGGANSYLLYGQTAFSRVTITTSY